MADSVDWLVFVCHSSIGFFLLVVLLVDVLPGVLVYWLTLVGSLADWLGFIGVLH